MRDDANAALDQFRYGRTLEVRHMRYGMVTVTFSKKELELLLHGLGNGIGDDAIENLGLTKQEQKILLAANEKLRSSYRSIPQSKKNAAK